MKRSVKSCLLVSALLAAAVPAHAAERSFRADYSVTLFGLPIGKARFDSTFSGDRFNVRGSVSSSGIARLFDRTTGTNSVEGEIRRDRVEPRTFDSAYRSGRRQSQTAIRYSGDTVSSVVNTPEPPRRGSNWVPVREDQLKAALDPISSTLIRTSDPAEVCDRTVSFFDGELRADLRLTPRSAGQDGRVVCDARFVPVAGYRKGRRQIEYLKNESRITIAFARLGDTGFYTPVDATVGTQIGTLRITASRIEAR